MPKHTKEIEFNDLDEKFYFDNGKIKYKYDILSLKGKITAKKDSIAGCYIGCRAKKGGTIQIFGKGFSAARAAYMLQTQKTIKPYFLINFKDGNPLNLNIDNLSVENPSSHENYYGKTKNLPFGVFLIKPKKHMNINTIRYCAKTTKMIDGVKIRKQGPYRKTPQEAENDFLFLSNCLHIKHEHVNA
jgi:hypothetical protein